MSTHRRRSVRYEIRKLAVTALFVLLIENVSAADRWKSSSESAGQRYQNTNYGFRLVVPKGWILTQTNFMAFHYCDLFLTINSKRPDLTIRAQTTHEDAHGQTVQFNPTTTLKQMQPGEVYVAIGYLDGPGGPTMQLDSVEKDLRSILASHQITASEETELSELNLNFFKRGHCWKIAAYLRAPVREEDCLWVRSILESFRFVDAPVANVAWAESLAWRHLPDHIRTLHDWPVVQEAGQRPQYGPRSLVVEKADSRYSVKFTVEPFGEWKYLVSERGRVVQIGE